MDPWPHRLAWGSSESHDAIQSVLVVAVTLRQPIDRSAAPDAREGPKQMFIRQLPTRFNSAHQTYRCCHNMACRRSSWKASIHRVQRCTWPEIWSGMSKAAQKKGEAGMGNLPKFDKARKLKGISFKGNHRKARKSWKFRRRRQSLARREQRSAQTSCGNPLARPQNPAISKHKASMHHGSSGIHTKKS